MKAFLIKKVYIKFLTKKIFYLCNLPEKKEVKKAMFLHLLLVTNVKIKENADYNLVVSLAKKKENFLQA